MATGDQNDFLARLKATLPPWFSDVTPVLDAVLYGWSATWAFLYALLSYVKLQIRLQTASDGWLDMIAGDFFGQALQRRSAQSDASYKALILSSIFRERATRAAIIKVMQDVTGRTPVVFEVRRIVDAGAYGKLYGYGAAGGYGSMLVAPYQLFVRAYRPTSGMLQYGVSDSQIYAALDAVRPIDVTIWTQITN
ncbi:hypothetical protein [Undibacterium sp.]|uniref:hypothetical protein n=1 Tax=Undibacterium sp. TaxID=1914977 RepID=UPI00374D83BE